MKKTILILIIAVAVLGGGLWFYNNHKVITPTTNNIEYGNDQYGFTFSLPPSWKGYSIIADKWEGYDLTQQSPQGQVITERGPMISIRHPLWTAQIPHQDIPIMVFTIAEWNDLQSDKFHIGAAPINPSELGRNSTYVFALPARYNFAYPEGYQEVEQILSQNPLRAFELTSTPQIIGGDKDAGGCLIGAGYSWCAIKNKCLRVWEESCGSGIRGKVTIGPTCPVQRVPPDPQCADKSFQAGFSVKNNTGQIIKTFTSDANGVFSAELPSGEFIITNIPAPGTYPRFSQQNITVSPGKYLDLNLQFDSGIR